MLLQPEEWDALEQKNTEKEEAKRKRKEEQEEDYEERSSNITSERAEKRTSANSLDA